jgi:lipoic acid synthetase
MNIQRKPEWIRVHLNNGKGLNYTKDIIKQFSLNTVCEEANCPNRMECFSKKTATFMILGSNCSRNCRFCNVSHGKLEAIDKTEPENVANATISLGLKHVVVTSLTRDDLPDGGSEHFANVISSIKEKDKNIIIEVLIPDFQGNVEALKNVVAASPQIINHNIETVPRLYPEVRSMAKYNRSLELLMNVKQLNKNIFTKSGIMVGLGEKEDEVLQVFKDLRKAGCDFLTVGQYLSPSTKHFPVIEYIHPDLFKKYKELTLELGFSFVASAPLVRSSYNAAEMIKNK